MQTFHQRELVRFGTPDQRQRVARAVVRPRPRAPERARARTRAPTSPPTRSSGAPGSMLARSQRSQELKFEILVPIASPEPTAVASFNCHREHFAALYGLSVRGRRPCAHRVRRLRPRAHHARAVQAARRRPRRVAVRDPRAALGRGSVGGDMLSLLGLDPDTYRRPPAARRRSRLPRDELLHRHPDRARPCPRSRAARRARRNRADGLRGRPVDVLQARAAGPRAALRYRHSRDAALPPPATSTSSSSCGRAAR